MISDFTDDYEPTPEPKLRSTRRRPINSVVPLTFTGEIPYRIAKILNAKPCVYIPPVYPPITNIDGYIYSMGYKGEEEAQCRKLYTPTPDPVVDFVKPFVPLDPLHVHVNIHVLKNGTVKVKITVPLEPVYEYQRKGKMAPLNVRICAAKAAGYPESVLLKMLDNANESKTKQASLDDFIKLIFGKSMNAKVSKPKAKTVHEALLSKMKKKPAIKY